MRRGRLIVVLAGLAGGAAVIVLVVANLVIVRGAAGHLYGSAEAVPSNDVGLVLGTGPKLPGGGANPYFEDRIEAAERLYRSGRVAHLLLSGDRETAAMERALLKRGIPASAITVDERGYRTLDSVLRADSAYGLDAFTIVTQRFHAARAVALARHHGLDAVALGTPHPRNGDRVWVEVREVFARAMAFLDLHLLHRQPTSRGPRAPIEV